MQVRSPGSQRLGPLAVALAALAALALPSAASAGTLTVDHTAQTASYVAGAGEANEVSFYRLNAQYRIQDTGVDSVPLTEVGGSLCTLGEPWKYRCPSSSVETANVSLGDGADSFDASTTAIGVTLTAGAGAKTIATGDGDDSISARNGSPDQIVCGGGSDSVVGDADDTVDASCESVDLDASDDNSTSTPGSADPLGDPAGGAPGDDPGQGSGGDGDGPNVFETPVGLTVALSTVPVVNQRALIALACAAERTEGCRGVVTLELPARKQARRHGAKAARGQYVAQQRRRRGRRIGKRGYKIAAGQKKTVALPLLFRGHYRQVSRRRRRRAVLRIVERDPAGKVIDVQSRSITLRNRGQR